MSMMVQLECDDPCCTEYEFVDVYHTDLKAAAFISSYVPPEWEIVNTTSTGYPLLRCPAHAEG